MIEYKTIIGKRVVLVIVDEISSPGNSTLVPGKVALDEENYMLQVHPDVAVTYDGFEEGDFVGVGCEDFENDIIYLLPSNHEFRKKYNAEYMIVLK